ncbi:hypothetical protein CBR_g3156 [Chara braunii]|uniref:Rhodanese domain-containing protein n=1 Tax=Chara braunii TaxID=69332 RepID=A0A388KEX1_CHABU|nr:hypothetical protein CBR_g3156 [Chara braunii]|eukprot:GBG68615.1 hypothetical protein CBR_g3156 [Chara braunii]
MEMNGTAIALAAGNNAAYPRWSVSPSSAADGLPTCFSWTSPQSHRAGAQAASGFGSKSSDFYDGREMGGRDAMAASSLFLVNLVHNIERKTRERRLSAARSSLQDAQQLVQSGAVQSQWPAAARPMLSEGGCRLLDVRPAWEYERAHLKSSLHVPLFIEDTDTSLVGLLKSSINMGYGGVWMGTKVVKRNENFVDQVQRLAANDDKLIVACGEGLRSLLAVEELYDAGFTNMVWLRGGFNSSKPDDFPDVVGDTELRFATVGGVSKLFLNLTLFLMNVYKKLSPPESSTL